jgi:hypothetical protein
MASPPPTLDEELDLHRRLVENDPVASAQLAEVYLNFLIAFLRGTNDRSLPEEFIVEAAEDAIISLIKKPAAFDAARNRGERPLLAYLKMAAKRDLQNIHAREGRHQQGRQSLESVELSPEAGKYLSADEDPSWRLELREEAEKAGRDVIAPVRRGLSAGEERALELLLQGVRSTRVFAEALGIGGLPAPEQKMEVKRVKDMLKQRIKRMNHG